MKTDLERYMYFKISWVMIGIDWDKGKDESDSNSLLEEEPLEYLMFWWFYIYNPIPLSRE